MHRFLHIFVITCLLGLGLAEAGERVFPETASAADIVAGEHVHHDSDVEHSADADEDHCPDCCHAPCFWLASGDFGLSFSAEPLLVRTSLVRRHTSKRPPSLFRPPIA